MFRRILGALAATAVLAGCTSVTGTAGPSAAPSPSASSPPPPVKIPATALLQKEDVGEGNVLDTVPGTDMLSPCWGHPALPSDGYWDDRKTADLNYRFTNRREAFTNRAIPDGYVQEVLVTYRPGKAKGYLADVRDALSRCATVPFDDGDRWEQSIVAEGIGGDESLLWRRVYHPAKTAKNQRLQYSEAAVVRIRDVVIVLAFIPADGAPDRGQVDRLVKAAISRAAGLG
jgi:hypothetical protein